VYAGRDGGDRGYWKPVWNILSEGAFALILANAAHVKNVPGRKTDLNDAMWIADLLACGLIKASFVPPQDLQKLRSLMRTRKQLVREQTSHVQRIQKTLEEANIKLDAVISDILGANGRRMIEAMIAGVRDPRKSAGLANRRLKAKPKELYDALHGRLRQHHRFLLQLHLGQWDALERAIREIDREAAADHANGRGGPRRTGPLLRTDRAAVDDTRRRHLGGADDPGGNRPRHEPLCDGRPSGRLGRPIPRSEGECRPAAIDPPAQGRPLAEDDARAMRLGRQAQEGQLRPGPVLPAARPARSAKAICTVAASLLTAIYHIVKDRTSRRDLAAQHCDRRSSEAQAKRLLARRAKLGYAVQLQPIAAAA
jgi:transposase